MLRNPPALLTFFILLHDRVENKDIFVDLKKNNNGVYLKLSERNGKSRKTILIPASGIARLKAVLEEVMNISSSHSEVRCDSQKDGVNI